MASAISAILWLLLQSRIHASLQDESKLTSHCYHFPARDYGKPNNVKQTYGSSPKLILSAGDSAIDFTLLDSDVSNIFLLLRIFL